MHSASGVLGAVLIAAISVAAPSNQQAAVRSEILRVYPGSVARVGIAGNYAVALGDVIVESAHDRGEFLLERFPFGWQILESAPDTGGVQSCVFRAHGIDTTLESRLQHLIGIDSAPNDRTCAIRGLQRDTGDLKDVVTVRQVMHRGRSIVPYVRVYRDYALAEWYGGGGGQAILRKHRSSWDLLSGGGGAACPSDLVTYLHMPLETARALLRGAYENIQACKEQSSRNR